MMKSRKSPKKADISRPTNFCHVAHVHSPTHEWHFVFNDPDIKTFLEEAEVTDQQLQDPSTRIFIADFIRHHGVDVIREEVKSKLHSRRNCFSLPPREGEENEPPERRCRSLSPVPLEGVDETDIENIEDKFVEERTDQHTYRDTDEEREVTREISEQAALPAKPLDMDILRPPSQPIGNDAKLSSYQDIVRAGIVKPETQTTSRQPPQYINPPPVLRISTVE